jgi:DNA-binding NarL/FixJ family response regulator
MKHRDTPDQRARILIVDDHPLVRSGLRELINLQHDLVVCGEAAEANEAVRQVDAKKPELMIVDLSLKESSGLELIKRVKVRAPEVKMLVSSMYDESLYAERVLSAGALGYVNKQEAMEKVIEAIRCVLNGRVYLSSAMSDRMLRRLTADNQPPEQSPVETLSDRELEIFELIGRAHKTSEIARQLHLSVKTVESHREHIKDKLRLKTGIELARYAVQWVLEQGK